MNFKFLLGVILAAGLSFNAHAEKIAVLGVQQALLASDAAKNFRGSLKTEFSKDEQKVLDLEKQVKAAREKIGKNKDLVSSDELNKMKIQFQKVFAEYQRAGQELQQKRMQREQGFIQEMRPILDKVIRGLIEKEGYDVVIAKQATLFSKKELDITAQVVELLNKQ
ncbi:OmpH family outer membrane protein [uncultured Neptuniibacter sp.]|uniref:OmpH family outer membrane protein n=1 Tax=uncultured Neptuniibacter sp. TaxID=502143 RepID=UPI00262D2AF0|nr:OmpH family outer membrane protein [uncultured Neptuniibacter sp.]